MDIDRRTMLLAADGRQARLFEEKRRGGPLAERPEWLAGLAFDEGSQHSSPGRVYDSHGHAFHGIGRDAPHDRAERAFITALAARIDQLFSAHGFDELVVIAAPRALGVLRRELAPALKGRLVLSEAADRVRATGPQLRLALGALRRKSA